MANRRTMLKETPRKPRLVRRAVPERTTPDQVLVVIEDDRELRRLLRRILQPRGCRLVEAYTAREGIEAAERCRPDLILWDLEVDRADSASLIRRLRRRSAVPILLITNHW